jgi:2-oxoisovalerate dehydrogenase E1 component
VRLTVPRLSSHSGPDNQKGYRTEEEIAADLARDPLPNLRNYLVPSFMSADDWTALEATVAGDVAKGLERARARPAPDPANVRRFVYAEEPRDGEPVAFGGITASERESLDGTEEPATEGDFIRLAEAVRRTLARELEVNRRSWCSAKTWAQGRRAHGDRGTAEAVRRRSRVRHEPVGGRDHRARGGMALAGLVPVAEIQFRKYADPAQEQLNNCGTMRWRTANQFAAPIVVRMPGRIRQGRRRSVALGDRARCCGRTPSAGRWRCHRTRPTPRGCCAPRCGARTRRSSSSIARC